MIERDEFMTPAADARLDRYLLDLKRFAPRPGFADRVMARVRLPSPALARFTQKARALATPGRLWWASGLAAASSFAWTISISSWLPASGGAALESWFSGLTGVFWQETLQVVAGAARSTGLSAAGLFATFGSALFPAGVIAMFVPALSGAGLFLTLRQHRDKRIAAHAAR